MPIVYVKAPGVVLEAKVVTAQGSTVIVNVLESVSGMTP